MKMSPQFDARRESSCIRRPWLWKAKSESRQLSSKEKAIDAAIEAHAAQIRLGTRV